MWFSYDPEDGFETHDTEEQAREAAEAYIEQYLDGDGWAEEVEAVCYGKITHQSLVSKRTPVPEEEGSEFKEYVQYSLFPAIDYILVDAKAMAMAHPDTFKRPDQEKIAGLCPGDGALVCFKHGTDKEGFSGERMSVVIDSGADTNFIGRLNDDPESEKLTVRKGDWIHFSGRHIYGIDKMPEVAEETPA